MTEQYITLAPGETREVLFEAVPYKGKVYQVAVDGLTGSFEAVAPDGFYLFFTNPKLGSTTHWSAMLYDLSTHEWQDSDVTPIDKFIILHPSSLTFLLWIGEWWAGKIYGPYLITIPGLRGYTWDASAGKIDGVVCTELPTKLNKSIITGLIKSQAATLPVDTLVLTVESSGALTGYQNYAKYFVGTDLTIRVSLPRNASGGFALPTGQRVKVIASLVYDSSPISYWKGDSIEGVYPPPTYWFSATATQSSCGYPGSILYRYTVTSNKSAFSVVAVIRDSTYPSPPYPIRGMTSTTGPVSGFEGPCAEGFQHECWCHPTVGRTDLPEDSATARANGWVQVH